VGDGVGSADGDGDEEGLADGRAVAHPLSTSSANTLRSLTCSLPESPDAFGPARRLTKSVDVPDG
jgi:hypothetical protein